MSSNAARLDFLWIQKEEVVGIKQSTNDNTRSRQRDEITNQRENLWSKKCFRVLFSFSNFNVMFLLSVVWLVALLAIVTRWRILNISILIILNKKKPNPEHFLSIKAIKFIQIKCCPIPQMFIKHEIFFPCRLFRFEPFWFVAALFTFDDIIKGRTDQLASFAHDKNVKLVFCRSLSVWFSQKMIFKFALFDNRCWIWS